MAADTAGAVSRSVFTVDDCPPRDRFDCWRHSIAAIFDVDAAQDVIREFHAAIDTHLVGSLMLARTWTRRQHWVRSSRTIARDGMDHYLVQLYESGGQTVRTNGESRTMRAGQLIVCDLQRTMDNDASDLQNLSAFVPRALLAPQLERPDDAHGSIIDGAAPLGRALRDHLIGLKDAADSLSAEDAQEAAGATAGLIAASLNGIGRTAQGKAVAPPAPLLSRIKRHIAENLHDPLLTPESIARRHGLSQTSLYRMFQPEGGLFIYLRVMRLQSAFDALRDPHQLRRPVHDIAREAGYDSDAFFYRAFESMFDVTVSEVRKAAELATPSLSLPPGADRRYEQWMRSLRPCGKRSAAGAAAGIPG